MHGCHRLALVFHCRRDLGEESFLCLEQIRSPQQAQAETELPLTLLGPSSQDTLGYTSFKKEAAVASRRLPDICPGISF